MHDIKYIRKNPEEFDKQMQKRGFDPVSAKILEADKEARSGKTDLQALQEEANKTAKIIGSLMAEGKAEEAEKAKERSKELKQKIKDFKDENSEEAESAEVTKLLEVLPNILESVVPEGKDENDNVEVLKHLEPKKFDFEPKQHFEIGEELGVLDFERTALISGARFGSLFGGLARLERALANFALDVCSKEFGYKEASVPFMVRPQALYGTSNLPKFEEDLFKTTNGYYLIPTAEVPLTNMVRERIISESDFPVRLTALTACFRSEAGSAGKDTRGLIRMHQFQKVELVSIVKPEESEAEHERLTNVSEVILQKLELPYRKMLLCSGDTGFGSQKTYDLEVHLPGQGRYREIASCSNFGSFQARRMNARYRDAENKIHFLHTLNGTALALGRAIVAIVENYQTVDGSVLVPSALQTYMGEVTKLEKEELF